jgi:hypothetical protein
MLPRASTVPDAVTWSDAAVIRLSAGDTLISVRALEAIARCLTVVSLTAGVQALSQRIDEALGEERRERFVYPSPRRSRVVRSCIKRPSADGGRTNDGLYLAAIADPLSSHGRAR